MDPVTIIVGALTLGIAAGLKPTAEQAVKEAYLGLRTLIINRYKVSLVGLENKPDSKVQADAVKEILKDAGANEDVELLNKADKLFDLIKQYGRYVK